ncbi:hypothetical protein [Roseibium album]|uniref:Uncharacterized protein n=1 Tax=Roseibium album TaxID=311410 RepID=A0A0M7AQB8_9HYPH|nr:hypothetical protein [Roseibium album]MBG6156733.1 hypothetical protein [Labrenzia sp. EL_162]MBG6195327.1 hypothetical protein [Labrenzia sp. EL_159]MBG6203041.1 hypothetical protein [Labrenzia sp. EL_13]CTQ59794.1 hypothetical protein LA5094_02563 [Roseibium album]CTQ76313.1 hypothetical protein LA5095_03620 [Roseibium album]
MADFDDITGWREELEAFEKTEKGRTFFSDGRKNYSKLTFEQEVRYAEELFRHEEIHEALKKSARFVKYLDDNPDFGQDDEGFWDLCPVEDSKKIAAFRRWYAMKLNIALGPSTFSAGKSLANDVANGALASLRSPEAEKLVRDEYSWIVAFPQEMR